VEDEDGSRPLNNRKAMALIAKPTAQSRSGIHRSDIQPVSGASKAIVSGVGAIRKPALRGSRLLASWRKKGMSRMLTLIVMTLIQRTLVPRVNAWIRNKPRSRRGNGTRFSHSTDQTSTTMPISKAEITKKFCQPVFCAVANPNKMAEMLQEKANAPGISNGSRFVAAPWKLSAGRRTRAAPNPKNASSTERKKFDRQPKLYVSSPPITGPIV